MQEFTGTMQEYVCKNLIILDNGCSLSKVTAPPSRLRKQWGVNSFKYLVRKCEGLELSRTKQICSTKGCVTSSHYSTYVEKYKALPRFVRKCPIGKKWKNKTITVDRCKFWEMDARGLFDWSIHEYYPVCNGWLVLKEELVSEVSRIKRKLKKSVEELWT